MRILHIGSTLEIAGGIESFIMNMYRCMNKDNVTFDFLVTEEKENGYYKEEVVDYGGVIYTLKDERLSINNFINKYKIYRKYKKNIIHIHTNCGSRIFDGLLARIAGANNIIFHCHTCKGKATIKFKILQPIFRILGKHFWACSHEAAEYFFGRKFAKNRKYTLIHNAIDIDNYLYNYEDRKRIRDNYSWNDKFVLGFVGRLSREKNIPYVIDIYEEIRKVVKNCRLAIIGDGEELYCIERLIKEKGLEQCIDMLGNKSDVNKILSAIDYLVLPSFFEGLGIVLIEAQAASLPCIASETVPKETQVTPLISYMGIERSAKDWADAIIQKKVNRNICYKNMIEERGYSNIIEAKRLEDIYMYIYNK